jgi:hypothetical protein
MDFYSFKNQCARMVVIDFAHHSTVRNIISHHVTAPHVSNSGKIFKLFLITFITKMQSKK